MFQFATTRNTYLHMHIYNQFILIIYTYIKIEKCRKCRATVHNSIPEKKKKTIVELHNLRVINARIFEGKNGQNDG